MKMTNLTLSNSVTENKTYIDGFIFRKKMVTEIPEEKAKEILKKYPTLIETVGKEKAETMVKQPRSERALANSMNTAKDSAIVK